MSALEELAKGIKVLIVVLGLTFGLIFGLAFAIRVIPEDRFNKIIALMERGADKAAKLQGAVPHEINKEKPK